MRTRDVGIVALVVVGVLILLQLLGGVGMMGGMGMMGPGMMGRRWGGGWGTDWGFPFLGGLFWSLILVGLILVVISLTRREGPPDAGSSETPMDILKRRLAKGEIRLEEYEALKKEVS